VRVFTNFSKSIDQYAANFYNANVAHFNSNNSVGWGYLPNYQKFKEADLMSFSIIKKSSMFRKLVLLLCYFVFWLTNVDAQINNLVLFDIVKSSIWKSQKAFNRDTSIADLHLNHAIIRPLEISEMKDTMVFSAELNSRPEVLKRMSIGGFCRLTDGKSLFIQKEHLNQSGWEFMKWEVDSLKIQFHIDSLCNVDKPFWWEPAPLVCMNRVVVENRLKGGIKYFFANVEYYLKLEYMDKEYWPIKNYPAGFEKILDTASFSIFEIKIHQYLKMISFKREIISYVFDDEN
jgi:hypothetical protein